jgi:hypothetical protein
VNQASFQTPDLNLLRVFHEVMTETQWVLPVTESPSMTAISLYA